jgi:hypothetical protein
MELRYNDKLPALEILPPTHLDRFEKDISPERHKKTRSEERIFWLRMEITAALKSSRCNKPDGLQSV